MREEHGRTFPHGLQHLDSGRSGFTVALGRIEQGVDSLERTKARSGRDTALAQGWPVLWLYNKEGEFCQGGYVQGVEMGPGGTHPRCRLERLRPARDNQAGPERPSWVGSLGAVV